MDSNNVHTANSEPFGSEQMERRLARREENYATSAARCGLFPAKWLKLSKSWRVNLVAYKPPESGFYQVGEWLEVAYVASFG